MAKAFMIGDVHLGVHPLQLDKYLEIAKEYFEEFFFPLLKKYYRKGDKLFILGDLFDNRTYIDIKVMCYALDIFKWFEENEIDIEMLVGNHDMRGEKSYTYNSLRLFEKFENVKIYTKTEVINFDGKNIMMMPFITSHNEEKKVLESFKGQADYLFCHSDLAGAKNNINSPSLKHGLSVADFVAFPKVYSGHIHLRQTLGNFKFLGCPYHLDRNDKGDRKGVYILDIGKDKELFIENDISPEFKNLEIKTEEDIEKLEELNSNSKDNYDLVVSNTLLIENKQLRSKLQDISKKKKVASLTQIDDIKVEDTVSDIDIEEIGISLSIEDFIRDYVRKQESKEGIKDKVLIELEDVIKTYKSNV